MKKIIAFIKKPLFGIILLVLSILMFVLMAELPNSGMNGTRNVNFVYPVYMAESSDGLWAINDNYENIFVLDEDSRTEYVIHANEQESLFDLTFDDNGNLYVLISKNDDDLEEMEMDINVYDRDGDFVRNLVYYTEDDAYCDIYGLCYYDGKIQYLFIDANGDAFRVSCSVESTEMNMVKVEQRPDGCAISEAYCGDSGDYAIIYSDCSISILNEDGALKPCVASDYDVYKNPDGTLYYCAVPYQGDLVVVTGANGQRNLTYIDIEQGTSEDIFSSLDLYSYDSYNEEFADNLSINSVQNINGMIALAIYDEVFYIDLHDGTYREISGALNLPFSYAFLNWYNNTSIFIMIPLFVLGLILCIGNLMKWRLTMLWKQLFIIVPIVTIMFFVLTYDFAKQYSDIYARGVADKLMELNELAVRQIDVENLKEMSNFSIVTDGRLEEMEQYLYDFLNSNDSNWSRNIKCNVYLLHDGINGDLIGTSNQGNYPFLAKLYLADSIEEMEDIIYDNSKLGEMSTGNTYVMDTHTMSEDYLSVVSILYDQADEPIAAFMSEMTYSDFENERDDMIIELALKALLFLFLLIGAIFIITYINTRRLKLAENAITKIAAGDFNARINHVGKDEVGEICGGVNNMAKQLEQHFEILDRNEKFYYKFVPEKFKELLNKESFTDLELGDAQSADLTVLFCDIRSFSLNSEMMTAKENFEFVNVIYGKAGPIIRKHNGFVDKYIGDAVMALFERADDAVAAGIEIYQTIVLDPSTAQELKMKSINIGVGIHSGMARIGIVGEDERLSGTVISNTVNISSRLESITKTYNTAMIVTKETIDRLDDPDSLNTRYLGMVQVAGVNEVEAIYEVLDCLEDARRIPREKNSKAFREAIKTYHLGHPEDAALMLQELEQKNENDPVPAMYLEYIQEKIKTGDKEHNVFRFAKK